MKQIADHITKLKSSTVIVRCNYDVPIKNGLVTDDTRLQDSLQLINLLIKHSCQIILIAHTGRPNGSYSVKYSLLPVHQQLQHLTNQKIEFQHFTEDYNQIKHNKSANITLIDNLRFWSGEEKNSSQFARYFASLGDAYINECFATSHRSHASIVGIPQYIPGFAGISLFNEIKVLDQILQNPNKPLTLVMGGAKLDTKEPLITSFKNKADHILVGGKLALDLKTHPLQNIPQLIVADLVSSGKDITIKSAKQFAQIIHHSATVVWNGSMGVFEDHRYQQGTKIIADAINSTTAFTLVGGGDTEAAISILDDENNISHISSGGGAMLTYLSTNNLVGINFLK